jgi:hypothetical protein
MFLLSLLLEFLLLLLVSLLNAVVFTGYSSSPTAEDIHDDAIVPSAVTISDFNSIPAFAGIHTMLAVLSSLLFLQLLVSLLLRAVMILLSSLLLVVGIFCTKRWL